MRRFVAAAMAAMAVACAEKAPEPPNLAFEACSEVLRNAAKNPTSAEIPVPETIVSETEIRLEWGHGDGLRFMNNMGAMLDTTATCLAEADGTTLKWVSIDGDRVFESAEERAHQLASEYQLMEERIRRDMDAGPETAEDLARAAERAAYDAAETDP